MASTTMLNLVVAACDNRGIGIGGDLPWRLRKDMNFFKSITTETRGQDKTNMVIMGRKTWTSIPEKFRPLPGRVNVVLSTSMTEAPPGALLASSLREAVNLAAADSENIENVFIIGGASVYKEAVESQWPCRVYLTRVRKEFECDTFLDIPFEDCKQFRRVANPDSIPSEEQTDVCRKTKGNVSFHFEIYERI